MANKGQWRNQLNNNKSKKNNTKKNGSNFGKKGKQQKKREAADKNRSNSIKKTGNSRADERREGAARARENPVNKARGGAQNYIIKDKVQPIVSAPSKVVSGTLKNAQDTAGLNRHRSGAITPTRGNDRQNAKQQAASAKAAKNEQNRLKKIETNRQEHKKNGYDYGNKTIKTLDKYSKKIDKAFNEGKEKDLEYGASAFSDKKVDVPFYTKYAQGKAKAEAKKTLNANGVTQKKAKENVDNWITETESNWNKDGYKVSDDTVVTDDGKTWGQIKQEAYDQETARIKKERKNYINESTKGVGQLSAQDVYKGSVEMASEFIDYGVPYMATAKGSIKVAEKLMAKAAKAGKTGAKVAPKTEAAIGRLVADGKLTPQAAKQLNRQIAIKSGAKSFSKELVANALQDATIGTAIDLGKGINQGLEGKDLEKYMKDNAIANLALGVPMSAIAGRAGAKEAKKALSEDIAGSVNKFTNLTREEGIELDNLIKKSNAMERQGAGLGNVEAQRMSELQDKALGGDSAVVNSKGKIEVNKAETTVEGLSREDAKEYIKLRAKAAGGTIQPQEMGNLANLQKKVEQAYKQTEAKAQKTINISNKRITSAMQEDAEMAVRFFERTGDKARLKQAQDVLERAKKATLEKNKALETNIDKMKDITKGNYRWVDSKEMEALTGDGREGGFYDPATGEIVVNRDSPQAFQTIIGHETMHMMKAANREGYDKLANMLTDYVKELGEYDSLLAEAKRAYPELAGRKFDPKAQEALDEEVVSEMLGRYVFGEDDKFIKRLAKEDPSTLQRIIDYIKKLFADNKNEELAKQLSNLEETALEEIRKINPSAIEKGGDIKQSNFGYHAGDLGKSESMGNQTGSRDTGHFGTGTYFVGNKAKIDGYNARNGKPAPVETVDFDKYNLYKPYNTKEAQDLHDFLRDVNDYFELVDSPKTERNFVSNIKRRTDDVGYRLWSAEDDVESLESSVKSMDDDDLLALDVAEQKVKELREEVYNIGKDALGEHRVKQLVKGEDPSNLSHEDANEILWELEHPDANGWYSNWERPLDKISSFYNKLDIWAIRLGTSKDKLLESLRKAKKQSESLPYGSEKRYTADSASTILMKDLGYEGVDVRHTDLDNTRYGSVIYDLKGEDLARKNEIGTARFSRFGVKGATGEQKVLGEQAEQMFKDGKTPEEIWNKTGVIVDTDGKAKWEFSDKDMKFKFKMKDLRGEGRIEDGRLEDLLEHKELFDRYPQLKDVQVEFATKSDLDGALGEYLAFGDFKLLRLAKGQSKEEMMDSIIHEIQHAIQEEEGFAGGASTEYYEKVWKNMTDEINRYKRDLPNGIDTDDYGAIDLIRMDDGEEVATKYERLLSARNELRGEFKGYGFRGNKAADLLVESGRIPYSHTKGEWEARQTEKRRKMSQEELDAKPREEDKHEIKREDYDEYYSSDIKASKFAKETQNAKTSRDTVNATKKEKKALEQKLSGKLSKDKRAEVEDQLVKLEERLEKETAFMHQSNTPIYKKRIEENRKAIKELEKELKKTKDADEIKKIQKQITNKERWITTNENWINWKPKQVVSDVPVKELSDGDLSKEYNSINKELGKEQESIRTKRLLEERRDALSKEAEKRDLDLRGNLEKADELIKEKRFGYEEAEELTKKIREIDKQVAELDAKKKTTARVHKIDSLEAERKKLNTRLSNVIENSKSVIKEGEDPIDAFNKTVGGNTLKAKGEGKMLNKFSVRKLLDENDGSKWGATKDLGQAIRRKTESSLIEYESAGKRLIKDGNKELGQALLDQTNNVIVYKNKAAAAIETHRANADGTKVGESLNDVFKVTDKNKKVVDLLEEENTKMRQDLSNYLFAKHSFAREEQGKKVFGIIGEDGKPKWTNASTQEFMDAIVREYGEDTVKEFEKGVREFIDYLNEYRLDTGLISRELLDKLNDIYPYYIPTNRSVINKPPKEYELPKNVAEVENGIKRAVGGDAPLEDLYTQLAKMTMATIRSGEQNKLLAMYAKAHNIEATRLPKDATADDVLESSVEAFDSDHKGNWKVRFYDHGEAVTIPVNKHAAKGLREFNGQDYATLMEVSAKAGQLLHLRAYKGLITDWNVVFGVRNGMRDAQQALVNSKDSRWYVRSLPRAMAAITNENNAFRILYDANGGRYSTLQQINRLDEIGALNKGKSTVAKGLEKIEDFNGIIEMKPRMQEFIGTIQKEADNILGKDGVDKLMKDIEAEAKAKPESERTAWIENEYAKRIVDLIKKEKPDIIATAIRNAADITVNFSRSGVFTKALNAGFVPYLNPSIQGLSKMARMFTETKSNGLLALGGFMGRLTLLTATPAVINEVLCQGNEAYQSLNTRDKDNNFFIPMSLFGGEKDKFIKIPKPRENSVLAEPFEYGYRWLFQYAEYGNKDDFKQMFESAIDNVGVVNVWEDNIFSPIIDTTQNETWYGGKILSDQELKNVKNGEAWKNYDETSTWFAKKIGKTMNWSPKKVDNIMDSYMGLIYDFGISQTSQKNINDVYSSPKNFLKGNPIIQQFTKDAVFSNKYATKFWDKAYELNEGHKGDKDTIEYREYMAKYGYDTFTYDSAISNIDNDKNIPKEEKVEMKRELRKYKNQLLHRALNGEDVKYDPMQRIINLYKAHGVKNATDVCLSTYAEGDHAEAYKHLKQSKEYRDATPAEQRELQQKFLKTYKGVKRIARFTGDSDKFVNYSTVEYVCVKNGYTGGLIANMYAWKSKEYAVEKGLKDMQKYIDAGYTEKNFKVTMRAMNRGADALGDPDKQYASQLDDYDKAMICAKNGYRDGAYLIASPYIGKARMNAGRCLVEGHSGEDFKWTDKRINKFCKKYDITADKNHKWDLEQVADAVRKEYGDKTPEEQAAVYVVITGDTENNPFGEIGDYSHDNDSGLLEDEKKKGKGGRGRGRGRRGRGGGGKGSKGTMPSTSSGAIKGKVTDPFAGSNGSKASNLNDAYRKKVRKLREQMNK